MVNVWVVNVLQSPVAGYSKNFGEPVPSINVLGRAFTFTNITEEGSKLIMYISWRSYGSGSAERGKGANYVDFFFKLHCDQTV